MRSALEREYTEYVQGRIPALRRLAYHLCGDPHRGDDLVQQAITRLYVHGRRARTAGNTDAYLHKILVRVFLDERRLGWARVTLVASTPDAAAADSSADERIVLRAALARLPRNLCAVLVLRFLADLSVEDVAGVLGCRPGTVKSRTSRGLAELRQLLDERPIPIPAKEI